MTNERIERFKLVNLGELGAKGESAFSTIGVPHATNLIEAGWIPCGMYVKANNEVVQTFYYPKELKA